MKEEAEEDEEDEVETSSNAGAPVKSNFEMAMI
jgi:hypothetical protein